MAIKQVQVGPYSRNEREKATNHILCFLYTLGIACIPLGKYFGIKEYEERVMRRNGYGKK